jgi:choline kinase
MIDQALVLAAGTGTRIRAPGSELPKPLHVVGGVTLLKRTLLTLAAAGVERAVVVIGYQHDRVRSALASDDDYRRHGLSIETVLNPDYERANGVSVLAARAHLQEGFVLTMSDHVYDVALAQLAAAADLSSADLYLCVDRRLADIYDPEDATKVRSRDGFIVEIGKTLADYDCVDCGVFAASPALFDELAAVRAERGDCSLSEGVKRLAERARARVLPIGEAFWQDVDTPGARERAEIELARRG